MPTERDTYAAFIAGKTISHENPGVPATSEEIHHALYPFQRDVTTWALSTGRAAIFADCGLGKTLMQVEWARHVAEHTGRPVLVVVPLAVAEQTHREAELIGVLASRWAGSMAACGGVVLVNYQRLHTVETGRWGGIVLDESSILKNMLGSVRSQIVEFASTIPHRLACTATPAPNDLIELLNHAAYLGIMTVKEAQATWFINDQAMANTWRLKGHAAADFWRWVSTWAVAFRTPRDIGHEQAGFDLPPYDLHTHLSETEPDAEDGRTVRGRRTRGPPPVSVGHG